jgi:ubiquinol-cytochrome c reductase cytochrome c subunit
VSVTVGLRARRAAAVAVLFGVLVPGAALGTAQGEPAVPSPSPSPGSDGVQLYGQMCATCHGQRGEGTTRGPSLLRVGPATVDFQLSTGRMPLQLGQQYQAKHQPTVLSSEQISALVSYIDSLAPGGEPIPDVRPAGVADGRTLFVQYCAACHSAGGEGGALSRGQAAPQLSQATPTQVGEAVRTGPGLMPAFPESLLSSADVDALAKYIQTLQNRDGDLDRGGLPLGRLGPLTEGIVGWIAGVALLVLAVRWLARKSG